MTKRNKVVLGVLLAAVLMAGIGYLTWIGQTLKPGDLHFDAKVTSIPVENLPLCDEKRTVKPCAATKVDWNKLEVQVAPGVTRTVVGTAFLPNVKD